MVEGFFKVTQLTQVRAPEPLVPRCGKCGLLKTCRSPKMPVDGEGRRRILIVGEAPGRTEDAENRPLVGKSGQHLERCLRKFGIDMRRDCWLTNSLRCRPIDNATPTVQQIDHCRPNLTRTLRELKPEVILLLGGPAVRALLGARSDTGPVTRWVGWQIPCQLRNAWICPTFHPSYCLRASDNRDPMPQMFFERHLKAVSKLKGRPWQELPHHPKQVRCLTDPEEAAQAIRGFLSSKVPVAFDYETDRLKPDHPDARIVSCAVSDGATTIAYPWQGKAIRTTGKLLASEVGKIACNLKFEERHSIRAFGVPVQNWVWDTMLAAHILDNRASEDKKGKGTTSIKFQALVLLGEPPWDEHVKPYLEGKGGNGRNRIAEVDLHHLLLYNGVDALLEWKVAMIQARQMGVKL